MYCPCQKKFKETKSHSPQATVLVFVSEPFPLHHLVSYCEVGLSFCYCLAC